MVGGSKNTKHWLRESQHLARDWYPDALIPIKYIQQGAIGPKGSWLYPLQLPDFNNRIGNQGFTNILDMINIFHRS